MPLPRQESRAKIHRDREVETIRIVGMDWVRDAACAKYDTLYSDLLFFPHFSGTVRPSERRRREAARCCLLCPVRPECMKHALQLESQQGELTGTWAGTSQPEREAGRHEEGCRSRGYRGDHACRGCRPRSERLVELDAVARAKASSTLAPWEEIAS